MALSNYTDLQAAVADWLHRDDLTTQIVDFIAMAEASMRVRCKTLNLETADAITITDGVGTLPSDFAGMRSCYWDDPTVSLKYIPPEFFDAMRDNTGTPGFYTITGSEIRTSPSDDGTLNLTYLADFVPLATSATNAILTRYPDVYLYGALAQASIFALDNDEGQKYGQLFAAAIERLNEDNDNRRFAGPLRVTSR